VPLAQPFAPFVEAPAALPVAAAAAARGLVPFPALYELPIRRGRPARAELRCDVDLGPFFITSLRLPGPFTSEVNDLSAEIQSGGRRLTEGPVPALMALSAPERGNFGPASQGQPRPIVLLPGDTLSVELARDTPAALYPTTTEPRAMLAIGYHIRTANNGRCPSNSDDVAREVLNSGEWYAAAVQLAQGFPDAFDSLRDARNISHPVQLERLYVTSELGEGGAWDGLELEAGTVSLTPNRLSSAAQDAGEPLHWSHTIRVRSVAGQLVTARASSMAAARVRAVFLGARFGS
jgi:hypothetical protein